jgi:hypothetical protein
MSSECNNNRLSRASIVHVIYIGNEQNKSETPHQIVKTFLSY